MNIDFHTHVFHPKIAEKVLMQLEGHYGISPVGTGTVDDLLMFMDEAGVKRSVVHTAATSPDQVLPANNWAIHLKKEYSRLEPFGTLHPEYAGWEKELERLESSGVLGIKFHPDFQGYDLADSRLHPFFEAMGSRFILMFHVGDRLPPDINPSSPAKLAQIRKNFKDLIIVAAHLGGYLHWEDSLEYLAGKDVYFDTSSSLPFIGTRLLKKIVSRHSRERILFGSDYPLFSPASEMILLKEKAGFSQEEIDTFMKNSARLLF